VTCQKAQELGLKKVGLFGTRFTMQRGFYNKVFDAQNISLITPDLDDQEYIHDKYMNELVYGIIKKETKENLLKIVNRLKEEQQIQGLILGGTELPLILSESDDEVIPFLDTTKIHVESIVDRLLVD
jgi:aspartate racemase